MYLVLIELSFIINVDTLEISGFQGQPQYADDYSY